MLQDGTKIGPYVIVASLGAGGMGEVYKARDTRLNRTVALKLLPPHVASDRQSRDRFEREAQAVAALNHPNICALHDIRHDEIEGTSGRVDYLVLEYVEGPTLAARLERGPLPLDQALRHATEILSALDRAHRAGIVHRDVKPANIMITKACIKLLDFGLAKAFAPEPSSDRASTLQQTALTEAGLIVGTVQYMAPEQVEGRAIDARTDLFAFGAVLYEMITGKKAFAGGSQASVMAAILEREPAPVSSVAPQASSLLDSVVRKCLAKNPDDRWQSAADLATALSWSVSASSGEASSMQHVAPSGSRRRWQLAGMAALAVAALAAGSALTQRYLSSAAPPTVGVRFEVPPPANAMWSPAPIASAAQLALSPDGRYLAFVAAPRRAASRIWVRPLDSIQAQPLDGTEGASFPAWSPDGRSIAFFAEGKLKKTAIAGGVPQSLADASFGRGLSWGRNGEILFIPGLGTPIERVLASGGSITPETAFDSNGETIAQYWPQFLSDGRRFLYYERSRNANKQGIYVKTLGASDAKLVLRTNGMAVLSEGHLLFVRDGVLFALEFDEQTLQTRGEPTQVADQVGYFGGPFGYIAVTSSNNGVLAYGPSVVMTTSLQWRNAQGELLSTPTKPNVFRSPRLSPDEKSVALSLLDSKTQSPDVWILELTRGGLSRVTSNPLNDWFPVWTPDGSRLFFASNRGATFTIYHKAPSDVGEGQLLSGAPSLATYPTDVTSDGRMIVCHQATADFGYDIVTMSSTVGAEPQPYHRSRFNEVEARFSPNGRWIAYASDESGRFEVYVRPFPAAAGQWPISAGGGMQPEWRRDGKELFFIAADSKLMAVNVTTDQPTFSAGIPRALFDVDLPESVAPYPSDYAVAADGQRFLVNTVVDQPIQPTLTVTLNWVERLKKN
ncbi:MAG: protein kinase domain-containing protein [Vicinamibacterales bacterium]